jgi:lipopolysaccharide export system protein LptA
MFAASNNSAPAAPGEDGIFLKADKIEFGSESSSARYIGNVIITITQEETVVTADNVEVFFKENSGSGSSLDGDATGEMQDSIDKIVATGSVRIVSTDIVANADKAVYDPAAGSLIMTGDQATIVRGAVTMYAPVIEMTGAL